MPLTILMVMVLGHQLLGLGLATALLFAGSLAPTDPVLAGDVQIEHDEDEEQAEAKFALTSEAGLNDALAFPFIHLAIAIAAAGSLTGKVLTDWVLVDVLWKLGAYAGGARKLTASARATGHRRGAKVVVWRRLGCVFAGNA